MAGMAYPSSPISRGLSGATDCNAMFNMLDSNNNGVLEMSELIRGLTDLGVRDEMIEAIFIHMDEVKHCSRQTTISSLFSDI